MMYRMMKICQNIDLGRQDKRRELGLEVYLHEENKTPQGPQQEPSPQDVPQTEGSGPPKTG
jgi:hypothetical protein